jgi:hypothetical protein
MGLKSHLSLGIASLAVLAGASSAQAASLEGRFGINPPTIPGVQTGISFIGTGQVDPNGNPLTDFDFVPPSGGGNGAVVEINANPAPNGGNDFVPFIGETGTALDLTVADLLPITTGSATLPNFIEIPGAFSITLTEVQFPQYTFDSSGTTVSIGVGVDVVNLSDGSGDVSSGVGTFSVDFAGLDPDQTRALFDEPGEIPDQFNPGTWSSNFVVQGVDVPPPPGEAVPEASNLLGLLAIGLGGATMLLRKNKLQ